MQQAKSSVEGLCTIVDHHYQEILDRVKALERQRFSQASREIIPSELDNRPRQSKQSAIVCAMDNSVIERASRNFFHFSFEKDLSTTRLYQKIKFRRSISSLVSVEEPATRWSMISGLSTIDGVSRLSVLSLAITPLEVYNHSRYTILLTNETETDTFPRPSEEIYQTEGQRDPPSSQTSEEIYKAEGQRDPPSPQLSEEIYRTEGQRDTPNSLFWEQFYQARGQRDMPIPLPSEEIDQFECEWHPPGTEDFKFLRLSMKAPTLTVLPVALKICKIKADWREYSLHILYSGQDRCLGLTEQPLFLFKQLDLDGRRPKFMLRRHNEPGVGMAPQPSEEINQTEGQRDLPSVEIFKSFGVSMEDPTHRVLPVALKKYNINTDWREYSLYIVYGDQERCLGPDEKPLILFKQLDREGHKPMFMMRRHATPAVGFTATPTSNERDHGWI